MTTERPLSAAGSQPNYGLPTTRKGQEEHSRQHRENGHEHPVFGYCQVALTIAAIEAEARATALAEVARAFGNHEGVGCCDPRTLEHVDQTIRAALAQPEGQGPSIDPAFDAAMDEVYRR